MCTIQSWFKTDPPSSKLLPKLQSFYNECPIESLVLFSLTLMRITHYQLRNLKITTTKIDKASNILNNIKCFSHECSFQGSHGDTYPSVLNQQKTALSISIPADCLSIPCCQEVGCVHYRMFKQWNYCLCLESDFHRKMLWGWVRKRMSYQTLCSFLWIFTFFKLFCIYYLFDSGSLNFFSSAFFPKFTVEDDQSVEFLLPQRLAFLQAQMNLVFQYQSLNTRHSSKDSIRLFRLWSQLPFTNFDTQDKSF